MTLNLPEGVRVVTVDCRSHPDPLLPLLSAEEQVYQAGLPDLRVRARFVHCRSTLRRELSALLDVPPPRVPLGVGPHGKPQLVPHEETPCTAASPLDFSVSHGGDYGLIALSHLGPVGIDLEPDRDVRRPLALAQRFFPKDLCAALEAVSHHGTRNALFLYHWTRLEAEAKAHGLGILRFLALKSRGAEEESLSQLGRDRGHEALNLRWAEPRLLESFTPWPGYKAALCVLSE